MVADSSALVAILLGEPEQAGFIAAIEQAETRLVSAATLVEAAVVMLGRKGEAGVAALRDFLDAAGIETVPVTGEQAALAIDAYRRFGRGRHPAALNLGDCFSYALARVAGEALLCKGEDFARTDIALVA